MPARSYEHLVGAYGVVGLSGVKDARKSVVGCRRHASADSPPTVEIAEQALSESEANTEQLLSNP